MAKKRSSAKQKTPSSAAKGSSSKATTKPLVGEQRINKVLAAAGLGSRREVEELIVQGRVEVDREIVTDLAHKLDPSSSTVKVDGQPIKRFRPVYFMLNKPKGVLSTNKDPSGRMRVVDLVPDSERVFSVGRLDKSSEGLMLLTNDGALAQRLAHPRYRVTKTYFVVVSGVMSKEQLAKLRKGVYLAEGFARIDGAKIRKQKKSSTELEITLSEGKNREIRRILAREGHKVVVLRRLAIGPLRLGQLPVGGSRNLTAAEVKALYAITTTSSKKKAKKAPAKKRSSKASASPQADAGELDDIVASQPTEDSFEFDTDFSDYDDDFVGGFDAPISEGSVLAYEEESSPSTKSRKQSGKRSVQRSDKRSSRRQPAKASKRTTSSRKKPTAKSGAGARASKRGTATAHPKRTSKKTAKPKPAAKASKSRSSRGTGKSSASSGRKGSKRAASASGKGKKRR